MTSMDMIELDNAGNTVNLLREPFIRKYVVANRFPPPPPHRTWPFLFLEVRSDVVA